jgi:hypothetical protein
MKKYKLELTREQLKVIQEACEFFSRFSAGQTNCLPSSLQSWLWKKWGDDFCKQRDLYDENLKSLSMNMFGLPPNTSLGIGNENLLENAKIAYDIYRPILEQFAKEYDKYHDTGETRTITTVYDYPSPAYSTEGRINIEMNEE